MARPLSEEKRLAILNAATEAVATEGIGATTAKIAAAAGVSEGTIFTYFATKHDLLNRLYLNLKAELAQIMFDAYPATGGLQNRLQHVWNAFIAWGYQNPVKRKAMRQLTVSDRITSENRQAGADAFAEVNRLLEEGVAKGPLIRRPPTFGGSLFEAVAEATLEYMHQHPLERDAYKQAGFAFVAKGLGL